MRKLFLLITLSFLAGCSGDNASNDNNNALFDTWLYTRTLDVFNGEVVNIYIPNDCGLNNNFTFSSNGTYTQYAGCSGELKEGTWVYKGNNIYEFIETTDGMYSPWGPVTMEFIDDNTMQMIYYQEDGSENVISHNEEYRRGN